MLAKQHCLAKERDFKKVNAMGRSFFSPYLRLKYLANRSEDSRFAVVVSLKASKKAVERNRIRRQLQEVLRLNRSKITAGNDIVISVNSKAIGKEQQVLEKDVLALLTKAKLML